MKSRSKLKTLALAFVMSFFLVACGNDNDALSECSLELSTSHANLNSEVALVVGFGGSRADAEATRAKVDAFQKQYAGNVCTTTQAGELTTVDVDAQSAQWIKSIDEKLGN